jgi:large subunit ribosomal protein L24
MKKIKKGDTVIVRAGKDKGRSGQVLAVLSASCASSVRVLVEGINLVKRHIKATQDRAGGIIQKEASIHISNIAMLNQATAKADKVGFKTLEDGRKVRFFKSTGEILDA